MFCKTCGLSINEYIMYCPGCGSKLDRNSLALNPLPGYVVHPNNEDATDTDIVPEVIIIDNPETDNTINVEATATIQLNDCSEKDKDSNEEQISRQIKRDCNNIAESDSKQNSVSDTSDSQNASELGSAIDETKRNTHVIIVSFLAVITVIGILFGIKVHFDNDNTDNDSTKFSDTSIEIASSTDITPTDIVLEGDNFIISKSIIVEGKEYDSKDLQHFTDKTIGVSVTLYKVKLNAADIQTYCDEQESAYQLQSNDILDVAYIGDIYRYHYAQGYYQYGTLYQDSLVVYEISDNIKTELCDEMAIDYFKTEGIIK